MRTTLSRSFALALLVCGVPGVEPMRAQVAPSPDAAARAISTVIQYRLSYLDDALPFDACRVKEALGGGEDFASRVPAQVKGMLDDVDNPCPRPFVRGRRVVLVDSVRLADSVASVHVTVIRGELIHREAYTLNPASTAAFMGVREVRLWGSVQAYPVRPSGGIRQRR